MDKPRPLRRIKAFHKRLAFNLETLCNCSGRRRDGINTAQGRNKMRRFLNDFCPCGGKSRIVRRHFNEISAPRCKHTIKNILSGL